MVILLYLWKSSTPLDAGGAVRGAAQSGGVQNRRDFRRQEHAGRRDHVPSGEVPGNGTSHSGARSRSQRDRPDEGSPRWKGSRAPASACLGREHDAAPTRGTGTVVAIRSINMDIERAIGERSNRTQDCSRATGTPGRTADSIGLVGKCRVRRKAYRHEQSASGEHDSVVGSATRVRRRR